MHKVSFPALLLEVTSQALRRILLVQTHVDPACLRICSLAVCILPNSICYTQFRTLLCPPSHLKMKLKSNISTLKKNLSSRKLQQQFEDQMGPHRLWGGEEGIIKKVTLSCCSHEWIRTLLAWLDNETRHADTINNLACAWNLNMQSTWCRWWSDDIKYASDDDDDDDVLGRWGCGPILER